MKVLITGAHFTPAAAVIEELKKNKDVDLVYVGRKTTQEGDSVSSIESQILPSMGVKFIPLVTGRLQRSFTIYTIPSLLKIPFGFLQAIQIILTEKPDVILSFGGYVAVPLVIIGWFFSTPVIVHEQTLVSGLANTISSYFADKIAISFPDTIKSEKVVLTGNPLRSEILNIKKSSKNNLLPVILITGGNQGSHTINLAVEEVLSDLVKITKIIHVTGESKYRDFERLSNFKNENYEVKKWINREWAEVLSKADLVVSRAGINTLSEMAYLGKPGLVVPLPYLYKDEQNKNARFFEKLGLVRILQQSKLSGENLLSEIKSMLDSLVSLKEKAKSAKEVVITDAAKRLALETLLCGEKEKSEK